MSTALRSRLRRVLRGLGRLVVGGLLLLLLVVGVAFVGRYELFRRLHQLPAYTHDGGDVTTVMVPMDDGVALHTRIVRPAGDGPAPTVLLRNPYSALTPTLWLYCGVFARYGYACVQQDVRGQGRSDGEWVPLVHERADGLSTLRWLTRQPFVDGNIALVGPSYLGGVQWAVADAVPPEVKTMVPMVFGPDLHPVVYERGLFRHEVMTAWAALMPTSGMRLMRGADDYLAALAHHPHDRVDVDVLGAELPWYRQWLSSPASTDAAWQRADVVELRTMPQRVHTPMLLIGGFFDPFFEAQQRAWSQLGSRADSAFVIGPWNHLGEVSGDVDMGPASGGGLMQWPLLLDWLGHHLKGEPLRLLRQGQVHLLAPGEQTWRDVPTWPPTTTTTTTTTDRELTLAPGAHGVVEAGVLPMPSTSTTLSWRHDPRSPTLSQGGAALLAFAFFPSDSVTPGPVQQDPSFTSTTTSSSTTTTEPTRARGITMRSAPLTSDVFISGAARLQLTVTSTTTDTAVVARLIVEGQQRPDDAVLMREAAATLAFPTSELREPLHAVGEAVTLRFDFWPIAWRVPKGARLRLDLTSSSFPALAIHTNHQTPWASWTDDDFHTVADIAVVDDGHARLSVPLWSGPDAAP